MKKFYSIILLITFLVGTLQPIMPMIEYQLFEGSLLELLDDETCQLQEFDDIVQCLADDDCSNCGDDQQLLDIDFYPLALEITAIPDPSVFLLGARMYLPLFEQAAEPALLSQPPPPRMS